MSIVRNKIFSVARASLDDSHRIRIQVQELCERAGVSRSSFYREFRNLNDVVASLAVERWCKGMNKMIAHYRQAPPSVERFKAFIEVFVDNARGESSYLEGGDGGMNQVIALMYSDEERHLCQVLSVLQPFIEKAQTDGVARKDLPAAYLSDWLMRQIWSLASVPFPVRSVNQSLHSYLELFVYPVIFPAQALDTIPRELETISRRLARLEQQVIGATVFQTAGQNDA